MTKPMFRHFLMRLTIAGMALLACAPLRAAPPHVKVTWLGGPTVVMEFNGLKVLTDPMLGEGASAFTMGDPNEMFDLQKDRGSESSSG